MFKPSTILVLVAVFVLNLLIWVTINKPHHPTESGYPVNSLSFNPFKKNQSPFDHIYLTWEDLEQDIKLLEGKTKTIRLYSSIAGEEQIPVIAKKHDIKVVAFLDNPKGESTSDLEVESAIKMAKQNKNVMAVIIGNETQLRKRVPREDLIYYLRKARKELKTPVSTAESWDYWLNNPDMANEVDFIAIHILPYWNEEPIEQAVNMVFDRYTTVKATFPRKKVIIAETGWPSDGPQRGAAVASLANQAAFIRDFVQRAEEMGIEYNIIEAFDQPWKSQIEGRAGEHWGIMDADRQEKFPLQGPVLEDPNWKYWALSSAIIGFLSILVFFSRRHHLKLKGQIFSIIIFQLAAAAATQLAREASDQYMSPGDILFWTIMITAQVYLAIIFSGVSKPFSI